jgi:hypothetical protein
MMAKKTPRCPKCKHDPHPANDCKERICDAAGDMDWCPCGAGQPEAVQKRIKAYKKAIDRFNDRDAALIDDLRQELGKEYPALAFPTVHVFFEKIVARVIDKRLK